jgi:hypothetical protein
MLDSAAAAARARQTEAELALVAAQQDLAEASPATVGESPLPSDLPFVGTYRTNFAEIYANRTAPAGLKRIDRTLPVFQRLIEARAAAVSKEGQTLMSLTDAYQRGQVGLPQLMESFLQLRQQRIAFLASVRDYNYSIADYAISVVTPDLGRDAVVSMLIETSNVRAAGKSIVAPRSETQSPATQNAAPQATTAGSRFNSAATGTNAALPTAPPAAYRAADAAPALGRPAASGSPSYAPAAAIAPPAQGAASSQTPSVLVPQSSRLTTPPAAIAPPTTPAGSTPAPSRVFPLAPR